MLILATSDLHGNVSFYRSIVRLARSHRPDAVVLAGDLSGGSTSPETEAERLLNILTGIRTPVYFLMGNDDELDWAGLAHGMRPLNQRAYPLGPWSIDEAHGRAGRHFNVAAPASKKALLLNLKNLTAEGLPL